MLLAVCGKGKCVCVCVCVCVYVNNYALHTQATCLYFSLFDKVYSVLIANMGFHTKIGVTFNFIELSCEKGGWEIKPKLVKWFLYFFIDRNHRIHSLIIDLHGFVCLTASLSFLFLLFCLLTSLKSPWKPDLVFLSCWNDSGKNRF